MNKTIFTLVNDTGSALSNGAATMTARSRTSLAGKNIANIESPIATAKQTGQSSALSSAQAALPWGPLEDLDDGDKLFRLFRWACNQESLDFAARPRSERVFAVIAIPADLKISADLLAELVSLLQQSNYDADAPAPKFGAAQKLLIRPKAVRNA